MGKRLSITLLWIALSHWVNASQEGPTLENIDSLIKKARMDLLELEKQQSTLSAGSEQWRSLYNQIMFRRRDLLDYEIYKGTHPKNGYDDFGFSG